MLYIQTVQLNIYNFIHHQTMIANNEKKTTYINNKHLDYVNYKCAKKTLPKNLYFPAKTSLLFFQNSTGQVKIKLHTTISNGF